MTKILWLSFACLLVVNLASSHGPPPPEPPFVTAWKNYFAGAARAEAASQHNPVALNSQVKSFEEICEEALRKDGPFTVFILKLIHEIQSHMHDGIPAMGIPPMDPMKLNKSVNFEIDEPKYTFKGQLKNVVVLNLASFNLTSLETSIFAMSANMSMDIPYFTIAGDYILNGKILRFIPVYGQGSFTMRPSGVTWKTFASLRMTGGKFQVKSLDFVVDLKHLHVQFDGVMGGGTVGEIFNDIMNAIGVNLFRRLEPMIHAELKEIMTKELNKLLENIPLGVVAKGMLSGCS